MTLLLLAAPLSAEDSLPALRDEFARRWFSPDAHLRLAKHHMQNGNRLLAFYISETARSHFPAEIFDAAARRIFLEDDFDNGPEAERLLRQRLQAAPQDPDVLTALADVHLSRGEWKEAEKHFRAVLVADPDSEVIWVLAEVLRRDGRESERDRLIADWLTAHPDSLPAWTHKIESAMQSQNPDAMKLVDQAVEKFPGDAQLHFNRGIILQRADDDEGAAAAFIRAAELDPHSARIQGWTARFFLKVVGDREKALEYYLNAYFLDPHFYDTEYAEGRIRRLAYEMAAAKGSAAADAGAKAVDLLADEHPVILGFALYEVGRTWTPEALPRVVALLAHDDSNIRYRAAGVLADNAPPDFDDQLRALLKDADLRVRSGAAYIAGERWKEKAVPLMTAWLDDPADLMRYDAVSVLLQSGGEPGRNAIRAYAASAKSTDPRILAILEAFDQKKSGVKPAPDDNALLPPEQ